jgi:hypothetical protein
MAWPSTPLTSYVSNTVPAIKAFDLNAFQTAVNGIINSTYSHKSVVIDAVGGLIVSPVAGTLGITTSGSSKTFPNPTIPDGTFYKDQFAAGWVIVDSTGVPYKGVNVTGVTHPATGRYVVTFNTSLGGSLLLDLPASVTIIQSGSKGYTNYNTNIASPTQIIVETYNAVTDALADFPFCLIVYGAP